MGCEGNRGTVEARWVVEWEQTWGCEEEGGSGGSGKTWPCTVSLIAGLLSIHSSPSLSILIYQPIHLPIFLSGLYHFSSFHLCKVFSKPVERRLLLYP